MRFVLNERGVEFYEGDDPLEEVALKILRERCIKWRLGICVRVPDRQQFFDKFWPTLKAFGFGHKFMYGDEDCTQIVATYLTWSSDGQGT